MEVCVLLVTYNIISGRAIALSKLPQNIVKIASLLKKKILCVKTMCHDKQRITFNVIQNTHTLL